MRPSSWIRPGSPVGSVAQRVGVGGPGATAGWCWRDRGRCAPPTAQARRCRRRRPAREERITGNAWRDAVPHSPDSRPLTMPRSTAQSTGLVLPASPKGHCSAITAVVSPRSSARAAKPCRRQRLGHHMHGGTHGPLSLARRHPRGQRSPVFLADVRRHLLGLLRPSRRIASPRRRMRSPSRRCMSRAGALPPRRSSASTGGRLRRRCVRSRP